ncbi:MAG: DUF4838 domain-containing protein [Eubacteriales bacterium]|nr:DUF4838 domain-containing protein [Eubacteriales bacterium]
MISRRGLLIHPEEISPRWLPRLRAAGINVLGLHPVGGAAAPASLAGLLSFAETPAMKDFLQALSAAGIAVEYEMHAMSYLLPRELFSEHPEYFPMNAQGQRDPACNLCVSSAEALALVADRAEALCRALPAQTHRYFLWLDDISTRGCQCPACVALSPSDQQMTALNAMLIGLRRADPQAKLAYLAYMDTLPAPTRVKPLPGIFLEYAPFRRDFHRPIDDDACPENREQTASLPDLLRLFGTRDAQVLEYWMDNSLYSKWTKPPRPFALEEEMMRRDVAYYRALGFDSVTSFGCYLGADYEALYGEPPIQAYGDILRAQK